MHIGRAVSRFYVALPVSWMIMGSLAGMLLGLGGVLGLAGWQWMLLIEAVPALAVAALLLALLPDAPGTVTWLTAPEKAWLAAQLEADAARFGTSHAGMWQILRDRVVLGMGLVIGLNFLGFNAMYFYAPKMLVQVAGFSPGAAGFVLAAFGVPAAWAMLTVSGAVDRRQAHHATMAALMLTAAVAAMAMLLALRLTSPIGAWALVASYAVFTISTTVVGTIGLPTSSTMVPPQSRATAFAAINTISQVGNFLGPVLLGFAITATGGYAWAIAVMPLPLLAGAVLVLALRRRLPGPVPLAA